MIIRYFFKNIILLSCVLCVYCTQPVQIDTPDQKEFTSVWQYLKTYSIYQNLDPNPFSYSTPQAMLDSTYDTLQRIYYTSYLVDDVNNYLEKTSASGNLVSFEPLTDSCCLVTISSFKDENSSSVYDEFQDILPQLNRFSKIIFDVRYNGGGNIVTMDSIIEDILPAGIRYLRTQERVYNASAKTASTVDSIWQTKRPPKSAFVNKKFAVLINEWSASASEIFAIALKDGLGVPVYGTKSYGKAIGQIELRRRERLGLKITFAHFYRIVNLDNKVYEDYHRIGITPDTVSDLLQRQSIGISDKPLFYAIKTLQPSIAKIEIQYPLSKRRAPVTESGNGLQKIVNESDLY